jgi:hypothetical protein
MGYYSKLEESGWLKHVRLILKAGVLAAEKLHLEGTCLGCEYETPARSSPQHTMLHCTVTYYSEPYSFQVCPF